jgi:hypothetical protein
MLSVKTKGKYNNESWIHWSVEGRVDVFALVNKWCHEFTWRELVSERLLALQR